MFKKLTLWNYFYYNYHFNSNIKMMSLKKSAIFYLKKTQTIF